MKRGHFKLLHSLLRRRFSLLLLSFFFIGCGNSGFHLDTSTLEHLQSSSMSTPLPTPPFDTGPNPTPTPPSPTPTPTPGSSPAEPPPVQGPKLQYFGRFDFATPEQPRFNWSGSAIAAKFKGPSVQVTLNSKDHYFVAVVDNREPQRFVISGTKTVTLADNLSAGEHKVLVMRDSEAGYGVSQFLGFNFGTGGELLTPDESNNPVRLEVIGDSITCGYGNLGANATCHFSLDTESAFSAYPQIAARLLGAPPATQLCISGRGIVRTNGRSLSNTSMTLPKAFPYTLGPNGHETIQGPLWTFPTAPGQQPTVVVVNLGTNDYWDNKEPATYRTEYINFVKQIRSRYPNAYIFLSIGSMNYNPEAAIQDVVNQLKKQGEQKISYLRFPGQQNVSGGIGCDYHPGKLTHKLMGEALANAIRQALNLPAPAASP